MQSEARIEIGGTYPTLDLVRTDDHTSDRHQHWEAIRSTGATSSHRFMLWTDDGGATWQGQMQARKQTHPGPVMQVRDQTSMDAAVRELKRLYRAYCAKRYG